MRGGERQVLALHNGLLARRIESMVVCRKGGELGSKAIANIHSIAWLGEWDIAGLFRFISLCKKLKPSIIHCHDGHSLSHAAIAAGLLGISVVYTRRVIFPVGKSFFPDGNTHRARRSSRYPAQLPKNAGMLFLPRAYTS